MNRLGSQHSENQRRILPGPAGPDRARADVGWRHLLLLAVHARVWFLNVPAALGLILVVTGLIWLWLPVPEKRALIGRQFDRIMSYLQWDPRESELRQSRHLLTDLLTESAMTSRLSTAVRASAALERSHNNAAPATPSAGEQVAAELAQC